MSGKLHELIPWLPVISFLFATATYILQGIFFDKLLRHEYTKYPNFWREDAKPNGFYWTAPDSTLRANFLRYPARLALRWAWVKPEWVVDEIANNLYNKLRLFNWLSFIAWLGFMLSLVIVFVAQGQWIK